MGNGSTSSKDSNIKDSISNGLKPYVKKLSFAEKLSIYLISRYGEPNGTFYILFAGTGALSLIVAAWLQSKIFFIIGVFLLLFSTLFYDTKNYYVTRMCKKCGKEFAYMETREPSILNSYSKIVTITSYYKCKYCGHEHEETRNVVSTSDIDVNYYTN